MRSPRGSLARLVIIATISCYCLCVAGGQGIAICYNCIIWYGNVSNKFSVEETILVYGYWLAGCNNYRST